MFDILSIIPAMSCEAFVSAYWICLITGGGLLVVSTAANDRPRTARRSRTCPLAHNILSRHRSAARYCTPQTVRSVQILSMRIKLISGEQTL